MTLQKMNYESHCYQNKNTCLLGSKIPQNKKSPINIHLIIGSLLFGAGWGLVGLCPGPAIASISFGGKEGYIFDNNIN